MQGMLGEHHYAEWTELVDVALAMNLIVSPRVARGSEVEAALELAALELGATDEKITWSRLLGVHAAMRRSMEECHGSFVRPSDILAMPEPSPRLRRVAEVWARAQELIRQGRTEFLADRLELLMEREPLCIGQYGEVIILPSVRPDPRAEKFFEWLAAGGTPLTVLRADFTVRPHWAGALFSGTHARADVQLSELRAPTAFAEAEHCVRHIARLLGEGTMPHQIAIFLPQGRQFGVLLQHAAAVHGLSVSWGPRAKITEIPFGQFVIEMLDVLARSSLRAMTRLANWTYWGFSRKQREIVEDWVRFEMLHGRRQLAVAEPPSDDPELTNWFTFLRDWVVESQEPRSLRLWSQRLEDLLRYESLVVGLTAEESTNNERDLRTRQAMARELVDCAAVRDRDATRQPNLSEFAAIAQRLWTQGEVVLPGRAAGGIPVIQDVDQLVSYEHIVVVGARERSIPGSVLEDPTLLDEDRLLINNQVAHAAKLPTMPERIAEERKRFALLCAAAKQSVKFIWPESVGSSAEVRSFYLAEIERTTEQELPLTRIGVTEFVPPLVECESPADSALAHALAEKARVPPVPIMTEFRNLLRIRPKSADATPLRAVLTARECTFRATARYMLGIYAPSETTPLQRFLDSTARLPYLHVPAAELATTYANALQSELTRVSWEMDPWTIQWLETTIELIAKNKAQGVVAANPLAKVRLTPHERLDPEKNEVGLSVPVHNSTERFQVTHRITHLGTVAVRNKDYFIVFMPPGRGIRSPDEDLAIECTFLLAALKSSQGFFARPTQGALQLVTVGTGLGEAPWRQSANIASLRGPYASDSPSWFKDAMKDAMTRLAENRMKAETGDHCRRCDYEDLCRKDDFSRFETEGADGTDA